MNDDESREERVFNGIIQVIQDGWRYKADQQHTESSNIIIVWKTLHECGRVARMSAHGRRRPTSCSEKGMLPASECWQFGPTYSIRRKRSAEEWHSRRCVGHLKKFNSPLICFSCVGKQPTLTCFSSPMLCFAIAFNVNRLEELFKSMSHVTRGEG